MLYQDLTHATTGIPLYPAFDDAFSEGVVIIAPETIEVTKALVEPGDACYAEGAITDPLLVRAPVRSPGRRRTIAQGRARCHLPEHLRRRPHVHVAINVEQIWGRRQTDDAQDDLPARGSADRGAARGREAVGVTVEWLFSAIVITSLAIVTLVVIAGGFLVVRDDDYEFAEYLSDLSGLWKILVSALIGTMGRALLPLIAKLARSEVAVGGNVFRRGRGGAGVGSGQPVRHPGPGDTAESGATRPLR